MVLKEFDPAAASNGEVLICYFYNSLRSSIWAQFDKQSWNLDTWEQVIKTDIDAEAKTACQPQSLIKEIDSCCLWDHCPSKTDKPIKEQKDSNSYKSKL